MGKVKENKLQYGLREGQRSLQELKGDDEGQKNQNEK